MTSRVGFDSAGGFSTSIFSLIEFDLQCGLEERHILSCASAGRTEVAADGFSSGVSPALPQQSLLKSRESGPSS